MTYDPTTALAIYVIAILVVATVIAAVGDYLAERARRAERDEARAEARAKRQRETSYQ